MKITKIEKQKKNQSRYNIFVDGEFAFGLYDDTLLKHGLRSGDVLTEKKVEQIRKEDEFIFGKRSAYNFLSRRQRSVNEVEQKLRQLEVSERTISEVIDYFEETGYLSDDKFSKEFIESKIRRRPTGRRIIKNGLRMKGIEDELAENLLRENYSENLELSKAEEAAKKYLMKNEKRFKNVLDRKSKLYRHLVSRGFPIDLIQKVLKDHN